MFPSPTSATVGRRSKSLKRSSVTSAGSEQWVPPIINLRTRFGALTSARYCGAVSIGDSGASADPSVNRGSLDRRRYADIIRSRKSKSNDFLDRLDGPLLGRKMIQCKSPHYEHLLGGRCQDSFLQPYLMLPLALISCLRKY